MGQEGQVGTKFEMQWFDVFWRYFDLKSDFDVRRFFVTYDFELLRMQSFVACDTDVFFNVTITALVTFRSLVMVQHNHSSSRDDYP